MRLSLYPPRPVQYHSSSRPRSRALRTEIAAQLPTKNPDSPFYVDRMLRLLACYSPHWLFEIHYRSEKKKMRRLRGSMDLLPRQKPLFPVKMELPCPHFHLIKD
ncbi:hypothetical protein SLA2020_084910 [Shorea laevis]